MGSLAEPCTEDMEPFMKTCKALCMVLWPCTAIPEVGLAKPAGGEKSAHLCFEWSFAHLCVSLDTTKTDKLSNKRTEKWTEN